MLVMCALPLLQLFPGVSSHNGHCLPPLVFYGTIGSLNIITHLWTHALQTYPHTPVCHANEQDVVEGVHSINLGQQLVDDGVVGAGAVPHAATLPADGINLIKDDDVQLLRGKQAAVSPTCGANRRQCYHANIDNAPLPRCRQMA